jgi:hypothetical protein
MLKNTRAAGLEVLKGRRIGIMNNIIRFWNAQRQFGCADDSAN